MTKSCDILKLLYRACILFVLIVIGIMACSKPQSDHQPPEKLSKHFEEKIGNFFSRFYNFEISAASLAQETQLLQQHEYWNDFSTHIKQEYAKAYVEGTLKFSKTLETRWPQSRLPTDHEFKFLKRYSNLGNRSHMLKKEHEWLINEWPEVLNAAAAANVTSSEENDPVLDSIWRQREIQVYSTLYAYEVNNMGLFVRKRP